MRKTYFYKPAFVELDRQYLTFFTSMKGSECGCGNTHRITVGEFVSAVKSFFQTQLSHISLLQEEKDISGKGFLPGNKTAAGA